MKRLLRFLFILGICAPLCAGCAGAVPADASADVCRDVAIVMYHSVLKDPARTGKYVVSPERLESDIVWLLDHGYTVVTAHAVVDFVKGMGPLPKKPVLLTFDDGYYNNLTYVLPLLQKYDCTAVIAIVGTYAQRFTDTPDPNPNYAHLSWDDIYALTLSGRIELANHTYDMHGQQGRMGSARKSGESDADYASAFTADVDRLQRELAARAFVTPTLFAYPYGIIDPDSRALLREMGFSGSLSCREKISRVVRGDPETLWELGRYNRAGDLTTEAFFSFLEK